MDETTDYYYDLPQGKVLERSAPLWRRIIAFIIDLLVFNLFLYTPFIQVFRLTSGLGGQLTIDYLLINPWISGIIIGVLIASTVIFCFYLSLSEYLFHKTIGQHLMGLWVEGSPSVWGWVSRNLLKSTLLPFIIIDLMGLLFNKQRLIDQALGVKVLYEDPILLTEGFI